MISKFKDIFDSRGLKLWLKPFNIIATCEDGGLIQTIPDSISIDKLKKSCPQFATLKQYFVATYKNAGKSVSGPTEKTSSRRITTNVAKGIKQLGPQHQI